MAYSLLNKLNSKLGVKKKDDDLTPSYLTPVVIHIWVAGVDIGGHVEILRRLQRLLLLHVHASTLYQSVRS